MLDGVSRVHRARPSVGEKARGTIMSTHLECAECHEAIITAHHDESTCPRCERPVCASDACFSAGSCQRCKAEDQILEQVRELIREGRTSKERIRIASLVINVACEERGRELLDQTAAAGRNP